MKTAPQTEAKPSAVPARIFTPVRSGLLQRKCACGGTPGPSGECETCRKKKLQRRSEDLDLSSVSAVPPIVHEVLRSPGQPLDEETRAFMEPRFGHDFGQVRVHTDGRATESTSAVNALAYTVGRDVVFGAGQYAPRTLAGNLLLAHELTHVVQQNASGTPALQTQFAGEQSDDPSEREADRMSHAVGGKQTYAANRAGGSLSYREATELADCIRIMGDAQYCREAVLGEKAQPHTAKTLEGQKAQPTAEKKQVVTKPAGQTISASDLEDAAGKKSEPVTVTGKIAGEGETSKQLKTGTQENTRSLKVEAEVGQEGSGSGIVSVTNKSTKETIDGTPPESSSSVEYHVGAKLPVGSWLFRESWRDRVAPFVILKEISVGGTLATKRPDDPLKRAATNLASDLSISLIDLELKSKNVESAFGLSALAGVESEREGYLRKKEGPWKTGYQAGGQLSAEFKYQPKGGFFIFVEGTAELITTREDGKWTPGTFTFTAVGGIGFTLPLSHKDAKKKHE